MYLVSVATLYALRARGQHKVVPPPILSGARHFVGNGGEGHVTHGRGKPHPLHDQASPPILTMPIL